MHVRLNDEQCLLWIKDPSISPFVNNQQIGRRIRKYRKNILTDIDNDSDDVLKNPKSFINKVRRRCFYNSALRQKIIDQIKEYQRDGTLRLYTLNDKITETIEYISEPFTREECMRWAKNHLVNPKTNNEINMDHSIYVELIYTTLQYGLSLPSIFDTEPKPTDIYQKSIHNIAKDVKTRLQFMKENDEYFLKHDVASFDKKLKIESARKATMKQKNTFSVSSSSNKSLNSAERRLLRDIELENIEEKQLAAEYQFKKRVLPISKRDIKNNIFDVFIEFIGKLQNEVMNGDKLINKILEDVNEHFKMNIITAINIYLQRKKYNPSNIKNFLKDNKLDTIEGVISNFITNIYSHILVPSIKIPLYMEIGLFSARNKLVHFKDNKIIMQITKN